MKDVRFPTINLDRSSDRRSDKSWIAEKLYDDKTRIIPVHKADVLIENAKESRAVYLTHKTLANDLELADSSCFLGVHGETPYFSVEIASSEFASALSFQQEATFQNFRSVVSLLDNATAELLSLARFMSYWHAKNRYCGKCGNKTESLEAGHVRLCQNEACSEHYYPNMDPAIIVLVSSGDKCLLGRQEAWPEGMYSTLAGFVEPGERLEEAVVREIGEEAGITVNNVEYQHSQSWLFPNSLMLGFTAAAEDEEITLDENELEDARWFTREEIRVNPTMLPYKNSIAYQLIMEWLDKG